MTYIEYVAQRKESSSVKTLVDYFSFVKDRPELFKNPP